MASIGLSKPYFALYSAEGSTVTHSSGGVMGKYTDINIAPTGGDENILYGDNGPAESDTSFGGGTVTLGTTELLPEIAKTILGLKNVPVGTTPVLTTKDASWNVYDDSQQVPYVSVGGIVKKKVNGVIKWAAFVLEKVQFTTPGLEATTQGKTIEWKTPSLTANILRSDAEGHPWFRISSFLDTEADGETLVKDYLGITGQQEGTE